MVAIEDWTPYCGAAPLPAELLRRWNFDPVLLSVFALTVAGCMLLYVRSPQSMKSPCFLALAFALAVLLFVSPLCALASALFSVRVAHHVILTGVVAPLVIFSFAAPKIDKANFLVLAAPVHAAIFWAWHFPAGYEAALQTDAMYWFMQATLIVSAAFLWLAVRAASTPTAILILLFTMMQMGLLGALLTFAPAPLYAPHILTTEAWGLSALTDQQLAGGVMWVGGSCIYLAMALAIAWKLLGNREFAR